MACSAGRTARSGLFGLLGATARDSSVRDLVVRTAGLRSRDQDSFTDKEIRIAIADTFKTLDTNGSSSLDRREVKAALRQSRRRGRFGRPDAAEYTARRTWLRLDSNRDGTVKAEEWMAAVANALTEWDRNKDGILTRRELTRRR